MATDIMASKETVLNIFFNRSGWINIARSWFSNHGSWRNEVVQSFWLALIFLCLLFSDLPGVLQMNHVVIKGKTDSGCFSSDRYGLLVANGFSLLKDPVVING